MTAPIRAEVNSRTNKPSEKSLGPVERALLGLFSSKGKTVNADELRAWLHALSDLTQEQVQTAILRFNDEYTGFPTPAALRKCAGVPTPEDRAAIAWESVCRAARSYGAYGYLNFSDGLVNAAVRQCGGWKYMCSGEEGSLSWRRKEFIEAYQRVMRTGIGDTRPVRGIPMDIQPLIEVAVPLPQSLALPAPVPVKAIESRTVVAAALAGIGDVDR